ncbi:PilZ domain-containing protein [Parahaliea sp. F7430]|uniref:PilZ domain-containing protein n=1 Tax=Sediminihaliea albiluteola TaxID=2758564 RepID=A0A7W2TTG3_9GAMM|nr:PilZ domain-containing protein [Sediminihaliea albiluteola]MBA6411568.1 PilZ domain-containing protein [Sediminihaliea albiluteola]
MSEAYREKRDFTRIELDLPVTIHQGGSVWQQRLLSISLGGAATDQPDTWDAQYNEPFTLVIQLDESAELELHAYLQHVEAERLGFSVEHVDRENIDALVELLQQHVSDPDTINAEVEQLKAN